tara:strand:+ start:5500 stop:5760 length:261 start_codon:yes stop_codon:yes gene_type:complete
MKDLYFNDLEDKVENKFELVVLAAKRAREISQPINRAEGRNLQKRTTRSLNEIFSKDSEVDAIRERLIDDFQEELREKVKRDANTK